ncbi:hypothetical protein R5W23_002758 [Gemmata sp. JC673]|uniref:Uncharacterized protein n=1 Tax=Gemmata algarum TaxID=2975278 RepID=A0ABU5F428_9BACT|nr:hypothetical protein [Gemmata algarum]MDY3561480.1 hypothetical protein [Gemmata algarum]
MTYAKLRAWCECRAVVIACAAWAGVPTCCLGTFGDTLAKDPAGPLFWIVNAGAGGTIGAAGGLLACALVRPKRARKVSAGPTAVPAVVNERRRVRALRRLIGIPLALLGAVIWLFWISEAVRGPMR